jgi:inactivated superfamily I helicase
VKLVTGNDLASGDVIWWTGSDWSRHIEEAGDAGDRAEAIAREEEAARRVNGPYVIAATETPEGPRPAHIKDRIRALGPTVRPDLTLKPADASAGSWVI